jgi:Cys-tRNA(Pro) deacylase
MAATAEPGPAAAAAAAAGIAFEEVRMPRPPTSAEDSAAMQGIALHQLLRTIVLRRGHDDYVFVLVPGGRAIDWPRLRGHLGVRKVSLPDQDEAREATGYERGAITPFGARRAWPVIADATVAGQPLVAIGGGIRGVNLHLAADDMIAALGATVADVTKPDDRPEA